MTPGRHRTRRGPDAAAADRWAGERGFAVAMAVAACLVFSYLALDVIARGRATLLTVEAERVRARLSAAADAGVVLALQGLGSDDLRQRWPLAGPAHHLMFAGTALTITVEDERGKIALNQAPETEIRQLLAAAGLEGETLDAVTDAVLDWRDSDDQPRRPGTEEKGYRADRLPVVPRNGPFRTLDELGDVRGMSANLVDRLRPALSVSFLDPGRFDPQTAGPLARAAKSALDGPGAGRPPAALDGRGPALDTEMAPDLTGRRLTIRVLAEAGDGRFTRTALVEFTGLPDLPVRVISSE